jgi:hypothetical protein
VTSVSCARRRTAAAVVLVPGLRHGLPVLYAAERTRRRHLPNRTPPTRPRSFYGLRVFGAGLGNGSRQLRADKYAETIITYTRALCSTATAYRLCDTLYRLSHPYRYMVYSGCFPRNFSSFRFLFFVFAFPFEVTSRNTANLSRYIRANRKRVGNGRSTAIYYIIRFQQTPTVLQRTNYVPYVKFK